MESRIEQLIGDLEEYIESCKPKFMSSTEIIVNKDEIDDRLHDLRRKIPEEITWHRKIINNRDAILADAQTRPRRFWTKPPWRQMTFGCRLPDT